MSRVVVLRNLLQPILVLVLSGCVAHVDEAYVERPLQIEPASPPASHRTAYARAPVPVRNSMREDLEDERYRVRHLKFPAHGTNGQKDNLFSALYFESRRAGKRPLAIVLPVWGIHPYPPQKLTNSILEYSAGRWDVIWVRGQSYLFDWKAVADAQSEAGFRELFLANVQRIYDMIVDLRRLLDWLETQPKVDPQRIALVGFSIGASVASLAMAHDSRFAAGVFSMGGAHPVEIFLTCSDHPALVRDTALKRFGWSVDEYQEFLEMALADLDPADYAGTFAPERILVVQAGSDGCVPEASREDFWLALGRPRRITIPSTHKVAFLALTPLGFSYLARKIYDFLDEALGQGSPWIAALEAPPRGSGARLRSPPRDPVAGEVVPVDPVVVGRSEHGMRERERHERAIA